MTNHMGEHNLEMRGTSLRLRDLILRRGRLTRVRELGVLADRRALEVEEVRDCAASKGEER